MLKIFLVLFFSFCKIKGCYFNFCRSCVWNPALDCCKLVISWKTDNDVTISRHDIVIMFFWRCLVFLVRFSYRSKFHVNIITGPGIMPIFFYNELSRNLEVGTTPVWVLSNIWRLGQVRDTKSGTNIFNKMLLKAAKCQGYSFYRFWVIKVKPTGGLNYSPAPPRLGPRSYCFPKMLVLLAIFFTIKMYALTKI